MTLPELNDWDATRTALHQSMQVLRSTRLLGSKPLPNDLHYSAIPISNGATTGLLSFGGALQLNYRRAAIVYLKDGGEVFHIPLEGHNQTSLFDATFAAFARVGHNLEPNRSKITETTAFNLNPDTATHYAEIQWRMFMVLSVLKGRMLGGQTPVALWPHGFDLSTLWFVDGMNEHEDPHVNFGFSPGTPDIGQPYFYFYAWPVPEGLADKLPESITWHTAWSTPGGILRYDQFANNDTPEALPGNTLISVYNTVSALMRS